MISHTQVLPAHTVFTCLRPFDQEKRKRTLRFSVRLVWDQELLYVFVCVCVCLNTNIDTMMNLQSKNQHSLQLFTKSIHTILLTCGPGIAQINSMTRLYF